MQVYDQLHPIRAKRLAWYIKQLKPVVYYPLNERSGTVTKNYAPSTLGSHNGTFTGTVIGQDGLVGKAYNIDGENDEITIANNVALNPAVFSVMALVKITTFSGDTFRNNIVNKEGANSGYALRAGNRQLNFMVGSGSGTPEAIDAAQSMTAGIWYFVLGTYDGDTIEVFLNGTSKDTTASADYGTTTNNLLIGEATDAGRDIDGFVQHVAIFDKVLTLDERTKIARIAKLA